LAVSGIDPSAALFATVVASSLATLAMGFWANLPFAVAPGLEMNGFFAFVVCGTLHMTWQEGLGIVFISGLLCILFTALRVRKNIIASIPTGLKKAVGTSVGLFVATIGLYLAKLISFNKSGYIDFPNLHLGALVTSHAYILYIGFAISAALSWRQLRFPGGMLVAIIVGSVLCKLWGINVATAPSSSGNMFQAVGQLDWRVALSPIYWSPIIIFFIIDFVGGIGKFIGLTVSTNIQDKDGNVPNIARGLYVDGAGTVLGSILGTSSLIAFVESAVGIKVGGRTGLTAVVCGLLMAGSITFSPFLTWVPAEAAAGVLLFVGYLLLPAFWDWDNKKVSNQFDLIIAIIMGVVSVATFSLDKSLAIGFWAYFLQGVFVGGEKKSSYWLAGIAVVLTATIIWQIKNTVG
jgi:AGZA family xanthine/uracil permease-like MFS transporter